MWDDAQTTPRGKNGRAPDVFRFGGWLPMREHHDDEAVDFVIVGTGAGGGTLACRLAEAGFSVVGLDAGPWWRPLEDFASDELHQHKLYWTGERICDGDDPLQLGANNSGRSVGGSTVHFRNGVTAVPAGMVQIEKPARLWRRLAYRLARDVGLLPGG
jgi:choline dehydrogenase-like flavoprotein